MGLRAYIIKRIIYSFALLIFVVLLDYIIFFLMPGDPVAQFRQGLRERKETQEAIIRYWGFDQPHHVRFFKYLTNLLSWKFGTSVVWYTDVAREMNQRIPYTLLLLGSSTIFAIIIGVILGVIAAHKRGSPFDSASVVSSLIFYSLPTFWMGMVFILIFCQYLHWFEFAHAYPSDAAEWAKYGLRGKAWPEPYTVQSGLQNLQLTLSINPQETLIFLNGLFRHMFLPIFTLTIFQYGGFLLLTRATMLEALTEDYVVTARAKGVEERTVLFKHALKNASLPLITSIALSFGFILSGAIITEAVYTWPGLGQWTWRAINTLDYPVLMAIFYVIAICVIIAVFIADLMYGVVDPRIKYG
jgi:peptide/nickel transport system permease protein